MFRSTCCRWSTETNQEDSERVREMVGRALVHRAVQAQLSEHVFHAVASGSLPPAAGSIIRLSMAAIHDVENRHRRRRRGFGGRR